jgi:hypothetical protein
MRVVHPLACNAARLAVVLCAAFPSACTSGNDSFHDTLDLTERRPASEPPDASTTGDERRGADSATENTGADATESTDADAGNASVTGCGTSGSLMYLLTDMGVLRTFDPALLPTTPAPGNIPPGSFGTVGTAHCVLTDGTTSLPAGDLAVDETGGLWANDVAGNLLRIDPADATCTPTAFDPGPTGFTNMGMTFVGHADGGEALYVVDNAAGPLSNAGRGLATIDLTTFQFTLVGNFGAPLTGHVAELAGTADGRLYGFFLGVLGAPSWFAQIDPATGALLSSTTLPVSIGGVGQTHVAVAAALWGNVLYFFITNTSNAPWADVYAFDRATGTTTLVLSQIGFHVNGAAVRACGAPPSSD